MEPTAARAELDRATRESREAQVRAERLARQSENASKVADKAASEAAAIAARIQGAEADIAAAKARFSLARSARTALSDRLAERQQPLVRLTGALQTSARRPLALSALQPGSLKDLVYVRAVLDSAIPQIHKRTAALRSELEEGRRLERQAASALETLRANEQALRARRKELAQLETRQRLASREARGIATREGERALALAEEARDLNGLMGELDRAAGLRRELAALPGPILRPADPGAPPATDPDPLPMASPTAAASPPRDFQLPVQGRTLAGFGERRDSGSRTGGIEFASRENAQVVAPALGRVAFAGPYRGFGNIVIVEHPGGWTSLVTGMRAITVGTGDDVIGGSPIGTSGTTQTPIRFELRRDGEAINPLQFLR